jgi:hypothetical protein
MYAAAPRTCAVELVFKAANIGSHFSRPLGPNYIGRITRIVLLSARLTVGRPVSEIAPVLASGAFGNVKVDLAAIVRSGDN